MTVQPSGLDERQQRIAEALHERSSKLAGIYRSGLGALRNAPEKGCESAQVAIVCHCMRELMNGLPSVMASITTPRPSPSSGALVAKLPMLLARHPEVDLNLDQDVVPVPRVVARNLADLITARVQEDGRNLSNAAALITGGSDVKHPAIKQWNAAYDFFVGWSHLDRKHEQSRTLPGTEEIMNFVRVVEDIIDVHTKAFFENLHSIQDLLAQINKTTGEGE